MDKYILYGLVLAMPSVVAALVDALRADKEEKRARTKRSK